MRNLPAEKEKRVQSLGWEDSLKKETAMHSSILTLEIPWTEEPSSGYCPWGHKKVRYDLVTEQAHTHTHHRVSLGCREDWKTKNSFANLWQKNIKEKGLRNEHCMSQYNVRYTHHSTPKGGYEDQLCCQIWKSLEFTKCQTNVRNYFAHLLVLSTIRYVSKPKLWFND